MNTEGTSNTSSSAGPATPTNSRKERGAIAAQACESCRQRKQRCSEERPKCATCQRMNLECKYREPQPTKKDKTLVEILERLKSLEGKVDNLNVRGTFPLSIYGPMQSSPPHPPLTLDTGRSSSWSTSNVHLSGPTISSESPREVQYVSATHKMLSWPVLQQLLGNTPHKHPKPDAGGVAMFFGSQGRAMSLPTGIYEPATVGSEGSSLSLPVSRSAEGDRGHANVLNMNWETMQRLTKSYFETFNLMYPIIDRQAFQSEVLPAIAGHGLDESSTSTLACLIFALGEVAISGIQGAPIVAREGRPSGIKGGSTERPPGLSFFNEARRRMGFNLTECSLENVQMFALAALYYQTCCCHMEFWRMTISASLACQALLTSNPEELSTHRGDLIRRAFWHCSIMETCLNLELNIPLTGLDKLEELVGLPDFSDSFSEEDYIGNQASHFQEHFASQIVLRRLSVEFNTTLTNAFGPTPIPQVEASMAPAAITMKQLAAQLDQWRELLPVYLRWHEEQPGAFSSQSQGLYVNQSLYPPPVPDFHTNFMFTADLDIPPVSYPYAVDIQTASLRTRYYYVKYLLYRPFIYKALHHPEQMTRDDADGVVECLKAILKWPIAMSPTCFQKRLVPCLFFWSQNLLGILLVSNLSLLVLARAQQSGIEKHYGFLRSKTLEFGSVC
ncbi:hypothetical protein F5B20DRAFT_163700 [Whalleya microplaca]|nr:hypothetical protein F5B20DRAFT_163700 [Whalleya microplaca]